MTAPNIILFMFDDMAFEQLRRMPQMMKLAKSGVNFLNAIAITPLCQPARKTFLTGQYSHNHGIRDNSPRGITALDNATLLPRQLQLVGYRTSHIGKFDNTNVATDPVPVGWDDWHAMSPQQYFGYFINNNGVVTQGSNLTSDYYTNVCRDKALAFIATTTEPFFMQISVHCPHFDQPTVDFMNATPSPEYAGCIPTSRTAPRNPNFNVPMGTPPAYMAHAPMDSGKIAELDAFWRGQSEMLFSADAALAAIQAALVAAAKTNTVIVVSSDHGLYHGEGRDPAEKIAPYLPAMHIPMIFSGPSQYMAQNKSCFAMVTQADAAATILALSGATPARVLDGVSLVPLLTTPTGPEVRSHLLIEWLGNPGNTGWGLSVPTYQAMLSKQALYTLYSTSEQELFDLVADPWQLINQVGNPAYATVQAQLAALLTSSANCVGPACVLH